ncbi:MAG: DNA polymerase III subunit epsilon [Alphaproteobacteria bacterium]|nr:DNA polymerase III subunit epsilon [Alphaproteobacteria bacterium]
MAGKRRLTLTREIVLDTETTGMNPDDGDRIIEIGCVELENHVPTGKYLQLYINPERKIPAEATTIHGITDEFIVDKPIFSQVYSEFITFITGARLVIHNAEFDIKFINWELQNVGHPLVPWNSVTDTLMMARKKFPGSPANLDALCRRFNIDNTERTYHGALLDSELLAEVYLELLGGRQHGLILANSDNKTNSVNNIKAINNKKRTYKEPRPYSANTKELTEHKKLLEKLNNPLWNKVV